MDGKSESLALIEELSRFGVLDLPTVRKLQTVLSGEFLSIRVGRGQEFWDVRPYQPLDDPISSIDPHLSRRAGKLLTRIYREEKELRIFLGVDISKTMSWGGPPYGKPALLLKSMALIGCAALYQSNALGGFCIGLPETFRAPSHERRALWELVGETQKHLGCLERSEAWKIFPQLISLIGQPSVIFLLSDFLFDAESLRRHLALAISHEVMPVFIRSKFERELPEVGRGDIADLDGEYACSLNSRKPLARKRFSDIAADQEREAILAMRHVGITKLLRVCDPATIIEDLFYKTKIYS